MNPKEWHERYMRRAKLTFRLYSEAFMDPGPVMNGDCIDHYRWLTVKYDRMARELEKFL